MMLDTEALEPASCLTMLPQKFSAATTRNLTLLADCADPHAVPTAKRPSTVKELRARAPHLPQSSLYRKLAVLETSDVVRRFTRHGDHARFELDEDLTGHHHHLICSNCGAMTDVALPRTLEDQ